MRIYASCDVNELQGVGEEWLMSKDGQIRAILIDGNFLRPAGAGNEEETVSC